MEENKGKKLFIYNLNIIGFFLIFNYVYFRITAWHSGTRKPL